MKQYTGYGNRSQATPQTEPIPGSTQVPNNAGGYSWPTDDMTRLKRFLILGATGGTYYIGERKLVKDNLTSLENLLKAGRGLEVVQTIVEISDAGRAPSNDPALFALARCCAADDVATKRAAYEALPKVARIGTHLLHFMEYVKQFRGRGRIHRRAIKAWYQEKEASRLAYQLVKYQNRDGWTQRDVLRLARPKPVDSDHNALYHWVTKGWDATPESIPSEEALGLIWAFERAKKTSEPNEIADLILKYRLPREAVPPESLKSLKVWEALLEEMPLEAMTRNLATMTRNGVLVPMGAMTAMVVERLRSQDAIRKARLHPIKILAALTTYASGKSVRGDATWTPLQPIVDALSDAFYLSFANVIPTEKRLLLAIDTSASMSSYSSTVNGIPNLSCHQAAGAMALVTANSETRYHIIGVDTQVQEMPLSPKQRLDDVVRTLGMYRGGGTNLTLPMEYAMQKQLEVDAFVIYTDSETWAGRSGHPSQVLTEYRRRTGIPARVINVQMTATHVTNNDPNDALAFECIGMDTSTPEILSSFVRGEI